MKSNHLLLYSIFLLLILGCNTMNKDKTKTGIDKDKFGNINGKEIDIYTLTNRDMAFLLSIQKSYVLNRSILNME